jgi:prephenate dehydrogenase
MKIADAVNDHRSGYNSPSAKGAARLSEQEEQIQDAPPRPSLAETVVIFGLGLIGGSGARTTRRAWPKARLIGVDRELILEVATEQGIIDVGVVPEDAADPVRAADLVVLCLPVLALLETLERFSEPLSARAVITDTGSTKGVVAQCAARLGLERFVGGHPMAGMAAGGLANADPELFEGATWFLCPEPRTSEAALLLLRAWVGELGARAVEVDAEEHDRAVALTSHLPHLLVNALSESVLDMGALDAAGGSLRDLLKVAGAPFETWGDTLATNQPAIEEALAELIARLTHLKAHLGEKERMRDLFARGRACKERLGPSS